ncbi:hypothetical protein QWZ10_19500 [Paracoccus cavernae]|uniref:Uncharacterized protein n=1 Tax=Paracoccus cavernae TaxID=1571207 RepID=A0ABT8D9B4_9RHOB|nr:hypothetical protein [Paracoccus cavernae]
MSEALAPTCTLRILERWVPDKELPEIRSLTPVLQQLFYTAAGSQVWIDVPTVREPRT